MQRSASDLPESVPDEPHAANKRPSQALLAPDVSSRALASRAVSAPGFLFERRAGVRNAPRVAMASKSRHRSRTAKLTYCLRILNSTRRFRARFRAVMFGALGRVGP